MAATGSSDVDLDDLSLDELNRMQREVIKALVRLDLKNRQEARAEVDTLLQKRGLTLDNILDLDAKASRSQGVPKYRHPENPAVTWSGRGRRPDWIKEALARGVAIDSFAIG